MTEDELKKQFNRLIELDKHLSANDEDNFDPALINEIDGLLKMLGNEIDSNIEKNTPAPSSLNVKIKKLSPDAVIPKYSKDGDAGMDLVATSIISNTTFDITFGMGIALEIPKGYVGLIFPRSSIRKTDLSLTNCVGVIDSGYRGELQATFKKIYGKNDVRLDETDYKIGDRIAQIMIVPYPTIQFEEVDELTSTERGDGGFGSTGD